MRIAGMIKESIVDGPGFRTVVFFQGCTNNCPGCHNSETHDFNGGYEIDIKDIILFLKEDKLSTGITISGGDPMCQPDNLGRLLSAIKLEEDLFSKDIWVYTGFTIEELVETLIPEIVDFNKIDYLVDGRFDINKKTLSKQYIGSFNQRIINMKKFMSSNMTKLVEYEGDNYGIV